MILQKLKELELIGSDDKQQFLGTIRITCSVELVPNGIACLKLFSCLLVEKKKIIFECVSENLSILTGPILFWKNNRIY